MAVYRGRSTWSLDTEMPSPADLPVSADLRAVADLLDQFDLESAHRFSDRLRAEYADPAALVRILDTNEFWGGAGSLADEGMCPRPNQDRPEFRVARRDFWRYMARVGRFLSAEGGKNPRLASWTEVFDHWVQQGI